MPCLIGFSGQGLQHAHMFKCLQTDASGLAWMQEASHRLDRDLLNDKVVGDLCHDVLYAQLFIVLLSVGLFRCIESALGADSLLCGYSVGEVAAFGASTHLSMDVLIEVIKARVKAMQDAIHVASPRQSSGLVALKGRISFAQAQHIAQRCGCYMAIINAPDHFIVGGCDDALEALMHEALVAGVRTVRKLPIKLASHTPLLQAARAPFEAFLQKTVAQVPMKFPIINSITGASCTSSQVMIPWLAKALSQTLHWDRVMRLAPEFRVHTFLELGPGGHLKAMYPHDDSRVRVYGTEDFQSIHALRQLLAQRMNWRD